MAWEYGHSARNPERKGLGKMEIELTGFNEERYRAPQRYATAIHEAGHVVAAYALGVGMRNKGVVLRDSQVEGFVGGVA